MVVLHDFHSGNLNDTFQQFYPFFNYEIAVYRTESSRQIRASPGTPSIHSHAT